MPETFDPNDCLASQRTIGDCSVPVPSTPSASDGYAQAAAARSDSPGGHLQHPHEVIDAREILHDRVEDNDVKCFRFKILYLVGRTA